MTHLSISLRDDFDCDDDDGSDCRNNDEILTPPKNRSFTSCLTPPKNRSLTSSIRSLEDAFDFFGDDADVGSYYSSETSLI